MRQKRAPGQDKNATDVKYVDPTIDDVMNTLMSQMNEEHNAIFKDVLEGRVAGWQVEYVHGICVTLSQFQTAGHRLNEKNVDLSKQFALYERNPSTGLVEQVHNGVGEGILQLVKVASASGAGKPIYMANNVLRFMNGKGAKAYHPADMITPNTHPAHRAEAEKLAMENIELKGEAWKQKDAAKSGGGNVSRGPDVDVPF
jgi:hypothetical protein